MRHSYEIMRPTSTYVFSESPDQTVEQYWTVDSILLCSFNIFAQLDAGGILKAFYHPVLTPVVLFSSKFDGISNNIKITSPMDLNHWELFLELTFANVIQQRLNV